MTYQATEPLKPSQKVDSLPSVAPLLWRLGLTAFLYWGFIWVGSAVAEGYFRTIINCDLAVPLNGHCPTGTFHQDGACAPVAKTSPDWSGSAGCLDKDYVMTESTRLGGRISAVKGAFGTILSLYIGGSVVDTFGRKPALLLCLAFLTMSNVLFCISSRFPNSAHVLIYIGACCSSLTGLFGIACTAMAADFVPIDVNARGIAYSFLTILQHSGIIIAFVAAFFILKMNLIDYTFLYLLKSLCMALVFLVTYLFLKEQAYSLTANEAAPIRKVQDCIEAGQHGDAIGKARTCMNSVKELTDAFKVVWRDKFLRYQLIVGFVTGLSVSGAIQICGSFGISTVNLTISVSSLTGVFQPIAIVIGSYISSFLIPKFGPFYTSFAAGFVGVVGLIVTGLAAPYPACAPQFFWVGWCVVLGISWGISSPACMACICMRADSSLHGKIFAVQTFVGQGGIGGIVGSYVWSIYLFDGNIRQGWRAGQGFFISAALCFVATCYSIWLYWIYIVLEKQLKPKAEC